jgi:hypothetical protein
MVYAGVSEGRQFHDVTLEAQARIGLVWWFDLIWPAAAHGAILRRLVLSY